MDFWVNDVKYTIEDVDTKTILDLLKIILDRGVKTFNSEQQKQIEEIIIEIASMDEDLKNVIGQANDLETKLKNLDDNMPPLIPTANQSVLQKWLTDLSLLVSKNSTRGNGNVDQSGLQKQVYENQEKLSNLDNNNPLEVDPGIKSVLQQWLYSEHQDNNAVSEKLNNLDDNTPNSVSSSSRSVLQTWLVNLNNNLSITSTKLTNLDNNIPSNIPVGNQSVLQKWLTDLNSKFSFAMYPNAMRLFDSSYIAWEASLSDGDLYYFHADGSSATYNSYTYSMSRYAKHGSTRYGWLGVGFGNEAALYPDEPITLTIYGVQWNIGMAVINGLKTLNNGNITVFSDLPLFYGTQNGLNKQKLPIFGKWYTGEGLGTGENLYFVFAERFLGPSGNYVRGFLSQEIDVDTGNISLVVKNTDDPTGNRLLM